MKVMAGWIGIAAVLALLPGEAVARAIEVTGRCDFWEGGVFYPCKDPVDFAGGGGGRPTVHEPGGGRGGSGGGAARPAVTAKEQETDDKQDASPCAGETAGNPVVLYTGNKVAYPSGVGVGYAYSAGRLTGMTATIDGLTRTVASNITHQPFGLVDGWTYGNGLERLAHFDRNGRVFGLSVGAGNTLLQSLTYGFDAADNITAITDGVDAGQSRKFEYDTVGRLRAEKLGGKMWEFDANGNRTLLVGPGLASSYVVDPASNRLAALHAIGGSRYYGYDLRGNRIAESASGFEAKYRYDGFNRLHEATVNGATA